MCVLLNMFYTLNCAFELTKRKAASIVKGVLGQVDLFCFVLCVLS